MAEDLHWFKFSPSKWMTGRIRKEKDKIQVAFIVLICQYWKEKCSMTIEKAKDEIGGALDILVTKKIVKISGEYIKIGFLDEQMVEIGHTSEQRSKAAKIRWKQEKSKSMHVHTGAMQNDADKNREEKTRQDLIIEDWISWGKLIIEGKDQYWENMRGQKISQTEMDKFLSVATRKKWDLPTQQAFRISLKGFSDTSQQSNGTEKNRYKVQ